MKVISVSSIFLGVLGIVAATPASAGLITDGDFSSFSFNATGTATVTRESTGGNPRARLNVTTLEGFSNSPGTSTSHTNSFYSTSDSSLAILTKPVDAVPPIEARGCFRQDMLSCELFPSGVFRPPQIV